jgi:two-component sensor histidine kinase
MMQTGNPVIISDAAADPNWVPLAGWEWLRSYVSAPIRVAGQTVGFLNVDRTQPSRYGSADAQRLEAFAHHAATALQNAQLYAETQRQLGEQMALREAGAVISSTLDLGAVLGRIAEQMSLAVDATSAYICDFDVKTKGSSVLAEYISPQACDAERVSDLGAAYGENDEGFLALMRAGLHDVSHIDDLDLDEEERLHMERYGAQTILYIPLRIKGRLIGFTELWESRRRREFSPEELALCHGIAQQAAIALENARLYGQAQREIAVRREVEEQIKASLEEKEVLLKEIHHRVKNNLQVISSLLYLQSKKIQDKDTLEMFLESQHRVRSMALVHERLYRTGDLARVDCAEYVRDLARYLHLAYGAQVGPVKLDVKVDDIFLGIDTAVPCGLIINELVSNSFKHAFPSGREGEIFVGLGMKQDGCYSLTVRDNGVGIPAGWDLEDPESLGLRLVSRLVEQIEGVIELDRNGGTTFSIDFADPDSRVGE